ncbi:MAG TPA: zinc-dependent peptidase [Cytophagaceae bacterium]
MEYFIGLIVVLSGIIILSIFICRMYEVFGDLVGVPFNHLRIQQPLSEKDRRLLNAYSGLYRSLSPIGKKEFEKRLRHFMVNKRFIKRGNQQITHEMKLLVSSVAVQLTFGLKRTFFYKFPNILIYPQKYVSKITNKTHKGEVNLAGLIVFSWEDFLEGLKDPEDGINLGLHEFAHALKLEDAMHDEEYALIDKAALRRWRKLSESELEKVRSGENTFLRKYAGTNRDEFFAVCVEQFFEQPDEFYNALPELYTALSEVLNQDPANKIPIAG